MNGHYTPCNSGASTNLHTVAFFPVPFRGMIPGMASKYGNYIKEWRQHRGLSQKELVARLIELAGGTAPDDPDLRIPTTEASLSRIENGKQNFNIAALQALAHALEVEEPGWLLDRKPGPGAEVISIWDRLTPDDQIRANAVLTAMFGTAS